MKFDTEIIRDKYTTLPENAFAYSEIRKTTEDEIVCARE